MKAVRTNLVSDIPTNRHSHEYDLRVQPRPENPPEFTRLRGQCRGHVREVDHLMFGGSRGHLGIFGEANC